MTKAQVSDGIKLVDRQSKGANITRDNQSFTIKKADRRALITIGTEAEKEVLKGMEYTYES